ncbi:MAG TPA: hypothetical protein VHV51_23150 [Polyangiaceae bacterium]|jgi:hypothetical protein|nr:hypothetical protein [Polyangiaceae bacterium]
MNEVVKGMVQARGTTYRIVRIAHGHYNVVRVLDDVAVGTFTAWGALEVAPAGIEGTMLREIARLAIRAARTSWVGRLA